MSHGANEFGMIVTSSIIEVKELGIQDADLGIMKRI